MVLELQVLVGSHVDGPAAVMPEGFSTPCTRVGFLPGVCPQVDSQVAAMSETSSTRLARNRLQAHVASHANNTRSSRTHSSRTRSSRTQPSRTRSSKSSRTPGLACVRPHVDDPIIVPAEPLAADRAGEGLLTSVGPQVDGQSAALPEAPPTHFAYVRFLPRVRPDMHGQDTAVKETSAAHLTDVGFLSGVGPRVDGQVPADSEGLAADWTGVWFLSSVGSGVNLHFVFVPEGPPTNFTYHTRHSTLTSGLSGGPRRTSVAVTSPLRVQLRASSWF